MDLNYDITNLESTIYTFLDKKVVDEKVVFNAAER